MPIARIKPHNDYTVIMPELVTVALSVTDLFRSTDVHVSFGNNNGGVDLVLDNTYRNRVVNVPNGCDAIVRNFGPEIIDVSWK